MTIEQLNASKVPIVRLDPALNKLASQVLFPEKVAKANEVLKRIGIPKARPAKKEEMS